MSIYTDTNYYVYLYLREDMTPYYVGKGKDKRYRAKHNVSVPPPERIIFYMTNLSDSEAKNIEKELIQKYGRKDLGTGILRNLTDGGEGNNPGPETRAKQSVAKQNYKPWNAGKKGMQSHSKEAREKMRMAKLKPPKEIVFSECPYCKELKVKPKRVFCSNSCRAKHNAEKLSAEGRYGFQNKSNQDAAQLARRPVRLYGGAHTADIKSSC